VASGATLHVPSTAVNGYASHLSVVGTALGNRRARLSDDGASLKLVIPPKGLVIIVH
jgi:hypothetical protein